MLRRVIAEVLLVVIGVGAFTGCLTVNQPGAKSEPAIEINKPPPNEPPPPPPPP